MPSVMELVAYYIYALIQRNVISSGTYCSTAERQFRDHANHTPAGESFPGKPIGFPAALDAVNCIMR